MCGIVGVVGNVDTKNILINGLCRLEYRGYDSAGIFLAEDNQLYKAVGPLKKLQEEVPADAAGTLGIGHTRWATHGKATLENTHPHTSQSGRFVLVHNGVIENYRQLKETLLADDIFYGQTDSEVAVHLVEYFVNQGFTVPAAFLQTLNKIEGSYAFGLIDTQTPDTLYAAKNKSPLLVGLGGDFSLIASDALAVLDQTKNFLEIKDGEMVILQKDSVEIFDLAGQPVARQPFVTQLDANDLDKGAYPYYMIKEIAEQPSVVRKIIQQYLIEENYVAPALKEVIHEADHLYFVACGTSWHASRVGAKYFEEMAHIPATALLASEAGYRMPLLSARPVFIFLSQSGETADSRQVLVRVKELGYPTITLTNVLGSTLARESDFALPLLAGPEIAVASTKAYTAQVTVLACLAQQFARQNEKFDLAHELSLVATAMDTVITEQETLNLLVADYLTEQRNAFYIGRYLDYEVSLEAALKLKEISYVQAEGFAAGELKHGTIALIEEGTPVFAVITDPVTASHTRGNMEEVKSRGARLFSLVSESLANDDDTFVLPNVHPLLTPILSIVPAQLIAYYATLQRGLDVDKPRNLAKSVTVE
ncbi:glutamine--fructose-6-phosphate transaminase (isomerizing) [Enterococcus timonensis]|uniref:glutamine--fructose-6-phosphate transaminase (isomerizing) n=1 Tax=Enterococcus timonensis TaxID=1852364 RepID=UPI0008DA8F60|nr:glutamine--fructose-6-phosphate transaminase (isomerizing) [Enterococcus timonensis]